MLSSKFNGLVKVANGALKCNGCYLQDKWGYAVCVCLRTKGEKTLEESSWNLKRNQALAKPLHVLQAPPPRVLLSALALNSYLQIKKIDSLKRNQAIKTKKQRTKFCEI